MYLLVSVFNKMKSLYINTPCHSIGFNTYPLRSSQTEMFTDRLLRSMEVAYYYYPTV